MPVSPAPTTPVRDVPADVLQRFYDSVPLLMGVVELHRDYILHVTDNAAAAAFFGTTPDALQGQLASELGISAPDRARWLRHYRRSKETGASVRFRYPHDGPHRRCWLDATVSYLGPGPSGVGRYAYYVEDVTAQVKQHAALLLNETRQEALLRALPDLLFRLDGAGRYLDVHAPDPTPLPAPAETLFGRTLHEVLPAELADRLYAAIRRALTTGDVALVDYDLATETGERRYFEARVSPDTEHDEVLVLVRDQTERQRSRLDALQRSGLLSPGSQEETIPLGAPDLRPDVSLRDRLGTARPLPTKWGGARGSQRCLFAPLPSPPPASRGREMNTQTVSKEVRKEQQDGLDCTASAFVEGGTGTEGVGGMEKRERMEPPSTPCREAA